MTRPWLALLAPLIAGAGLILLAGITCELLADRPHTAAGRRARYQHGAPRHLRPRRRGDEHDGWEQHLAELAALRADHTAAAPASAAAAGELAPPPVARAVVPRAYCRPMRHPLSDRDPAPRLRPRLPNPLLAAHIAATTRSGGNR